MLCVSRFIDSRDIVELELKHQDYELIIRKKEALEPSPPAQPQVIHSPVTYPSYGVAPSHAPSHNLVPVDSSVAAEATLVEAPKAVSKSAANLPCIVSPMAGTFYKSPGPGEPAFVKVGKEKMWVIPYNRCLHFGFSTFVFVQFSAFTFRMV
jgi:acetyl-CoA carboxylase biotin carboxyl carrier protein